MNAMPQVVPLTKQSAAPDGRLRRPNGTFATANPDGSYNLLDGTKLLPDGGILLATGAIRLPDGNLLLPDGSIRVCRRLSQQCHRPGFPNGTRRRIGGGQNNNAS